MDEVLLRREFGRRIRRRRRALDMTQRQLAQQIDMLQTQLSRLENGEYHAVNLAKLVLLADVLHTTVDYLLGRSNEAGEVPESQVYARVA